MPNLLEKTGKIVFLRAHDLGTGYGPPDDQLDVEAVFILDALGEGAYGFQLRNDQYLPARQAMFSLLREAFTNNFTVIADYLIEPGKINGTAIRCAGAVIKLVDYREPSRVSARPRERPRYSERARGALRKIR
jgi:hypothetical protein